MVVALVPTLACTGAMTQTDGDGEGGQGGDGDGDGDDVKGGGGGSDRGGSSGRGGEGGDAPEACKDPRPAPVAPVLRRLTYGELAATIKDVLGVDASAEVAALPKDLGGPYSNDAATLTVSQDQALALGELAAKVVARAGVVTKVLERFTTCRTMESRCQDELVKNAGLRLLRRPLAADQVALYTGLFKVAAQQGDGFEVGAALVLRAMLQSPQFLYRVERETGGQDGWRKVDDYELAARLSFLLWGSTPDEPLLADAMAGRLGADETVRSHVTRMLAEPRANAGIITFGRDWLGLSQVDGLTVDDKLYAGFDATLRGEMKAESVAYFEDLWTSKAPVTEILTGRKTRASERVAKLYGLAAKPGVSTYELPSDRSGALSLAGFLAASSHVDPEHPEPSMVNRGLTVLRKVLCMDVPPPPKNINPVPFVAKAGATQRTAAEERGANATCKGCHGVIDPLAFALEPYDAMGRNRSKDQYGNALRSDGALTDVIVDEPGEYENARELFEMLAKSSKVEACVVNQTLQFALGRPMNEDDACLIEHTTAELRKAGARSFPDLVMAIATDPNLRLARTP